VSRCLSELSRKFFEFSQQCFYHWSQDKNSDRKMHNSWVVEMPLMTLQFSMKPKVIEINRLSHSIVSGIHGIFREYLLWVRASVNFQGNFLSYHCSQDKNSDRKLHNSWVVEMPLKTLQFSMKPKVIEINRLSHCVVSSSKKLSVYSVPKNKNISIKCDFPFLQSKTYRAPIIYIQYRRMAGSTSLLYFQVAIKFQKTKRIFHCY
jgi:hypothetical protein